MEVAEIELLIGRVRVLIRQADAKQHARQAELGLPSVLFGVGLPDENAHAPNEKLDLGNFHNGIIASAYLYEEIAGTQ